MKFSSQRIHKWRSVTAVFGTVVLGCGYAAGASASCASIEPLQPAATAFQDGVYANGGARLVRAAFAQVEDDAAPIVGLWKFTFTAKGNAHIPDGAPIDAGYVTWHSDGTELTNSSRPPLTQSFCMGAWAAVNHSTFKLNHYALSWDNTGTVMVGPANIREEVTVDALAMHYSGTFSITQYAVDEKTVLAYVQGTVSGTRITAN